MWGKGWGNRRDDGFQNENKRRIQNRPEKDNLPEKERRLRAGKMPEKERGLRAGKIPGSSSALGFSGSRLRQCAGAF